ncbi:MAG: alpha/beta fold hydrolase [Candidatus Rifleibacteriota bacterium]
MKNVFFKQIIIFSFALSAALCLAKEIPQGPVQPVEGPGGKIYRHKSLQTWQAGIGEDQYKVFEPDNPRPHSAGLVIFLHDWLASDPGYYMAWIKHIVLKGWVVVFPKYQGSGELEKTWTFNIIRSVKDFLQENFKRGRIKIDADKIGIIGHGAGAVLAANVAAVDSYFGLPRCKAIFIAMPHQKNLKLFDLSSISNDAKMIILTGDRMSPRNEETAREIFYASDRIKSGNKIYITVLSDFYGHPPLVADEKAVFSPELPQYERFIVENRYDFINLARDKFHAKAIRAKALDAFDWYATFRLFDALTDVCFSKTKVLNPFKNSSELRFMGYWSDGKRLRGLIGGNRP